MPKHGKLIQTSPWHPVTCVDLAEYSESAHGSTSNLDGLLSPVFESPTWLFPFIQSAVTLGRFAERSLHSLIGHVMYWGGCVLGTNQANR